MNKELIKLSSIQHQLIEKINRYIYRFSIPNLGDDFYNVRIQLAILDKFLKDEIEISLLDIRDEIKLDSTIIDLTQENIQLLLDNIILKFNITPDTGNGVIIEVCSKVNIEYFNYRCITMSNDKNDQSLYALDLENTYKYVTNNIRNIVFGNANSCNASCIHCPVNKSFMNKNKRFDNDIFFEDFIKQIRNLNVNILGYFSFGLFNESFIDKNIINKIKIVKKILGDIPIHINTNLALNIDNKILIECLEFVDIIDVHIESFEEKLYEEIMKPLKLNLVEKNLKLLFSSPLNNKVRMVIPVHKRNKENINFTIDKWKKISQNNSFVLLPYSSRSSVKLDQYSLHLNPLAHACRYQQILDLIIDYDYEALLCCNDFEKTESLGNIIETSLDEIYYGEKRKEYFVKLENGFYNNLEICKNCKFDNDIDYSEYKY